MKLRVLGCSGGIGSHDHTASFLLDQDILMEAGTGLTELSLQELSQIDHVFITHAHLDHYACLPLMLDSVGSVRQQPITVYALHETIEVLKTHIFNWHVWPDFTRIPGADEPYLRYHPLAVGDVVQLDGRTIEVLPANHVLPAAGYLLQGEQGCLAYTGDTTCQDAFWKIINQVDQLKYLIIETAFPDEEREIAEVSKHLSPGMLVEELNKLQHNVEVLITHLKPGKAEATMEQIRRRIKENSPKMLLNNQIFEF